MTTGFAAVDGFGDSWNDGADIREYFKGAYEIVHQIKGRIRVRLPQLAADRDAADRLTQTLSSIAGITQVSVNAIAKSVTIYYRENTAAARLIQSLPVPVESVLVKSETDRLLFPIPEGLDPELTRLLTDIAQTSTRLTQEFKPFLYRLAIVLLQATGGIFLVVGVVGVILPLLPGTPFLILSSLCFFAASELSSQL